MILSVYFMFLNEMRVSNLSQMVSVGFYVNIIIYLTLKTVGVHAQDS
jgi:hypothetical protein